MGQLMTCCKFLLEKEIEIINDSYKYNKEVGINEKRKKTREEKKIYNSLSEGEDYNIEDALKNNSFIKKKKKI
jgi:hypothetical protein